MRVIEGQKRAVLVIVDRWSWRQRRWFGSRRRHDRSTIPTMAGSIADTVDFRHMITLTDKSFSFIPSMIAPLGIPVN
jgi:hypothetical protein